MQHLRQSNPQRSVLGTLDVIVAFYIAHHCNVGWLNSGRLHEESHLPAPNPNNALKGTKSSAACCHLIQIVFRVNDAADQSAKSASFEICSKQFSNSKTTQLVTSPHLPKTNKNQVLIQQSKTHPQKASHALVSYKSSLVPEETRPCLPGSFLKYVSQVY